jgi:hypothetical protein
MANAALSQAGRRERIDRRTLAEQGVEREPINYTRAVLELDKRGVRTEQSEEMRRRKKRNRLRSAIAAAGRAVPVPHIEREDIREAPTVERERIRKHTREAPTADPAREKIREEIRRNLRRAGAVKETPAPVRQEEIQPPRRTIPKAPPKPSRGMRR